MTVHLGDSQGCSSFQFSSALLEAIEPLARKFKARQGQVITEQGEACRGVYVIQSGIVKLFTAAEGGKEVFKRILSAGCAIGLPATLCSEPYMFTAVCQGDAEIALIETSVFQEFLRMHPLLGMEVVRLMGQELSEVNQRRTNFKDCRACGCPLVDACEHELGGC